MAIETRQTRITARSDLKLAQALEQYAVLSRPRWTPARANVAQARVIVTALDRLPTMVSSRSTPTSVHGQSSTWSTSLRDYDAKALAVLGRKLFEVIAPDLADAYEAKVLTDQEAAAARRVIFTMREDDAGTCHGRFRIPSFHGQWLNKMLLALTSPVRSTTTDIDETCPPTSATARRSASSSRPSPARACPKAGGCGATIVVTMTLEQLLAELDAAGVCTWTPAATSPPPRPAASPAQPGSSPPCWAAGPSPSTSAADAGSTPRPSASRWDYETTAAPPKAATDHQRCATPTTTPPGARTETPTSRPADSSAATTTAASTTPATPTSDYPTARVSFHRRN